MSDFLLNKELESVKNDKKMSEVQLNASKAIMARNLIKQMKDLNLNTIPVPLKRKKPLKLKIKNFFNRIMTFLGLKTENDN